MPAIPFPSTSLSQIEQLVQRSTNTSVYNATGPRLEVVCAWPVSGQYGPGTRVLYYVLVAACVLARKAEWIRNAGLAAVLLFPAVAALHGIVLAALHREGAIDMDVYGAFQLCSIGILAAPVTVKLSKTYFNNPGRNIIFLWTGLLLAGLLSLTVEFIRIEPIDCPLDDPASSQWAQNRTFSYNSKCGMVCGEDGPYSPLRQGAADNIYVIPVPQELTFNTATLIAAACCVPAILSLVSTWIKILEINWERLSSGNAASAEKSEEEPIQGTNGATPKQMKGITSRIRGWLTLIETPVFVAAVLAILIKGEMNFFSKPVMYQTEPISSIGQWAPVVGTGLAAIGSLYILFAANMEADEQEEGSQDRTTNTNCSSNECLRVSNLENLDNASHNISPEQPDQSPFYSSQTLDDRHSAEMVRAITTENSIGPRIPRIKTNQSEKSIDPGGRKKVTRWLNLASKQLAVKAHSQFQDSGFNAKERSSFPEVPGENFRNRDLSEFQKAYSNSPIPRSRASSFIGSESSNGEGSSRTPLDIPRHLSLPVSSSSRLVTRPRHAHTLPSRGGSCGYGEESYDGTPPSRDSLSETSPTSLGPSGQDAPPRIVVSSD
ncbi:uncharacterized protein N7469_001065 [Penicillium citrinum]|uniref:Uncharacterized protein n=1 Tax=Penicillium citrinum TaxID=5077 RepID=A0A9W9TVI1_PENCI|nr:uncharacterized protein N7469_001065 [Penicillium citrinum]KAJ5242738.1 hypothetical protein N7469_001065 [Penicillium citrinum]